VRWTAEHAAARERLLSTAIDGRPALLKDPRTLLTLPFWRASSVPFHAIAIVRHPLAAARSLVAWRGMTLAEGLALWSAHNRALMTDRLQHEYPLIDFEGSREEMIAAVSAACHGFAPVIDAVAMAAAYEERLVHHDGEALPAIPGLADAEDLYRQLTGRVAGSMTTRRTYPHAAWAAFAEAVEAGDGARAVLAARAVADGIADVAAVLVPMVAALLRRRWNEQARVLVEDHRAALDAGLADLLLGKVALAAGDPVLSAAHLSAACSVPRPFFQARHLLPQALRQAGRFPEARAALVQIVGSALYPHGPLATLAEWAWLDGERAQALQYLGTAIDAAPPHRRGRLRTRRAEWLLADGDAAAARQDLERALAEDPAYQRAQVVLERLPARS
jgi:tetratricopeptide (TPR) repeat protein